MQFAFPYAWPFNPDRRTASPKRPGMAVFDSSPNARSKTMKTVEGAHTYGVSDSRDASDRTLARAQSLAAELKAYAVSLEDLDKEFRSALDWFWHKG